MSVPITLGATVREQRRTLGFNQRELAARVGVSRAYISRFESNDFARPSYIVLTAMAIALGYNSADQLVADAA